MYHLLSRAVFAALASAGDVTRAVLQCGTPMVGGGGVARRYDGCTTRVGLDDRGLLPAELTSAFGVAIGTSYGNPGGAGGTGGWGFGRREAQEC